ncbi:CLUMA_CG002999, isoform A [Clunio marinus]|uniref:CLUMA_CG002999, isoform A n=1 Tax=Clunio marinus TaxID=568069 RepID=A0A1J1HME5_9DIPT|nr:CLUMA_CG002999, isoform A [Clunio marinus]
MFKFVKRLSLLSLKIIFYLKPHRLNNPGGTLNILYVIPRLEIGAREYHDDGNDDDDDRWKWKLDSFMKRLVELNDDETNESKAFNEIQVNADLKELNKRLFSLLIAEFLRLNVDKDD